MMEGSVVLSREEQLWQRVEDQQRELESLREQKRDKDAAITFLKTKITTLQNKAGAQNAPHGAVQAQQAPIHVAAGEVQQDDLQVVLLHRDRRIQELEQQVTSLQQDLEQQASSLQEEMRQRERLHAEEVQGLHAAFSQCEEAMRQQHVATAHAAISHQAAAAEASKEAKEAEELRQRLQFRDEQVHSLGHAYETLQHQCQMQVRSGEEELQRREEQTQRLSASLRRAGADIEELQRQLKLKENEVANLADTLQACREKEWKQNGLSSNVSLSDKRFELADTQRGAAPVSARSLGSALRQPCSTGWTDGFALDPSGEGGSSASRGSPRPPLTPQPQSPGPGSAAPAEMEASGNFRWAHSVGPIPLEADRPKTPSRESPQLGLRERREGVLQLEEEIHKQIAKHRSTIAGGQTPQSPASQSSRCPWPLGTSGINLQVASRNVNSPSKSPCRLQNTAAPEEMPANSPTQLAHSSSGSNCGTPPPSEPAPAVAGGSVPSRTSKRAEASPLQASFCPAPTSPPALPLASSTRVQPGRAATASRVERQAKPPNRSGGALITVSIFDEEDPSQRRARQQAATQQRVAKQIEQRRRQVREKARPDDACRRTGDGSTQIACSPNAPSPAQVSPKPATATATAFPPSTPLLGGSAHVPLGGGIHRLHGDASLVKVGMVPVRRAQAVAASPVAGGGVGAEVRKMEPSQGDLHQRFASLRDEMKRQRGPAASVSGLGERGGSLTTSAVLSDLLQQS